MAAKRKSVDLFEEPPAIGHNGVDAKALLSYIERVENLAGEKQALTDDIKEVYGEAKGTGFDTKIMRKIVAIRKMDRDKRREEEERLDLYLNALGLL